MADSLSLVGATVLAIVSACCVSFQLSLLDFSEHDLEKAHPAFEKRFALTPREAEVLAWVTRGKTNGEIATILGLASGTVKCYLERILAKLGCETRTAAARTALEAIARI